MLGISRFLRGLRGALSKAGAPFSYVRRQYIVERYVRAGARFGEAISYIYMGECIGFHSIRARWERFERKYASLGYRTISLDDFIEYGGYGKSIDHLLRITREEGESAVIHADVYEHRYQAGFKPAIDVPAMLEDGQPRCGQYVLPTTKDAAEGTNPGPPPVCKGRDCKGKGGDKAP